MKKEAAIAYDDPQKGSSEPSPLVAYFVSVGFIYLVAVGVLLAIGTMIGI